MLLIFTLTLSAQSNAELMLKNSTGKVITELFVSSSATDLWGKELLSGKKTVPHNSVMKLSLSINGKENYYDIKAITEDGSTYNVFEQKIQSRTNVTLTAKHFDNKLQPTEKEALPEEIKESLTVKSGMPKKYIDGYKRGYLNGYDSGFQSGYEAALREIEKQQEATKKSSSKKRK